MEPGLLKQICRLPHYLWYKCKFFVGDLSAPKQFPQNRETEMSITQSQGPTFSLPCLHYSFFFFLKHTHQHEERRIFFTRIFLRVMLFLLWCLCVNVWYASPDRVSWCAEMRPAKEKNIFAQPPLAPWLKQKKNEGQHVSYILQEGGKIIKKKKGTKPLSIYSAISPFKRFVCLYRAYWTSLARLSAERKSTWEWSRRVPVDDCVLYRTRRQRFVVGRSVCKECFL